MNVIKINNSYAVIFVLIIFVLLNGCSTIAPTSKSTVEAISPTSDEVPKEIKVNEFILGSGDKVEIIVYRHDDLKRTIQIDTSGKITYPLVGDIQAGGLSIFQLRDKIRDGLLKYIIDPQVSIGVTAVQSQKVTVLGEVKNPGLFNLDISYTALEAISLAGGFTSNAKQQNILLIRGGLKNPELITLDFKRVFNEQDMTQNVYLQKGDIIYVPVTEIENIAQFFDHLQRILATFYQAIFTGIVTTSTPK